MVCIELALCYRHFGKVELVPVPNGCEGATFVWPGETPLTLEVQVKEAKGLVGVTELAGYLVHDPDRRATGFFERLFDRDDQHAMFGRCPFLL
jgi:hypothetical protein